jgi:Lar family restriction alleviation protein
MSKLKPCPHCGGKAALRIGNSFINCQSCGARTRSSEHTDVLYEIWNRRPIILQETTMSDLSNISTDLAADVLRRLIDIAHPRTPADIALLEMARNNLHAAIESDSCIRYETDSMSELRLLLTTSELDSISNRDVDAFRTCLIVLEKSGFTLSRKVIPS